MADLGLSLEVQKALIARWRAVAAITAIIGNRIFDIVPPTAAFPYVCAGDDTTVPNDDKSDGDGVDMTMTWHVWTQGDRGREVVKQLLDLMYDAVHNHDLVLGNSYSAVETRVTFKNSFKDPDGVSMHGVIIIRILT